MAAVKVLLAGPCNGGGVQRLFDRVAAVNKKNGPFDVLFCVGSFFGDGGRVACRGFICVCCMRQAAAGAVCCDDSGVAKWDASPCAHHPQTKTTQKDDDEGDVAPELEPYLDGTKQPPVPTYFVGGFGAFCAAFGARRTV